MFNFLRKNYQFGLRTYQHPCKVSFSIVRFQRNLKFLENSSKNIHGQNFVKIEPVGSSFPHTVGRTDGRTGAGTDATVLTVDFRNFGNASKNWSLLQIPPPSRHQHYTGRLMSFGKLNWNLIWELYGGRVHIWGISAKIFLCVCLCVCAWACVCVC